MRLSYALIGDGSSDRVLLHVVDWVLRQAFPSAAIEEPGFLPRGHRPVQEALDLARRRFGCSLYVVHRDAERLSWDERVQEVPRGADVVAVVPVRMTEAWMLGDADAIRLAAGNPSGRDDLGLPTMAAACVLPDPKLALRKALVRAAGNPSGRRLARFKRDGPRLAHLVAEYTSDFGHLRAAEPFCRFEAALVEAVRGGAGVVVL